MKPESTCISCLSTWAWSKCNHEPLSSSTILDMQTGFTCRPPPSHSYNSPVPELFGLSICKWWGKLNKAIFLEMQREHVTRKIMLPMAEDNWLLVSSRIWIKIHIWLNTLFCKYWEVVVQVSTVQVCKYTYRNNRLSLSWRVLTWGFLFASSG